MENDKNETQKVVFTLLGVAAVAFILPLLYIFLLKKLRNFNLYPKNILIRIFSALLFAAPLVLLRFFKWHWSFKHNTTFILILWSASVAIAFILVPLYRGEKKNITAKLIKPLKNPKPQLKDGSVFIAESMVTNDAVFLDYKMRVMHTVVVGSTGSGKTTLLDTLFETDLKNKKPIIIIDPKGNIKTIAKLKEKLKRNGIEESKFKEFSLINPNTSFHYNPLKNGTPTQIKDRLMGSLVWSEPFYKNQADTFLSCLFDITKTLGDTLSIKQIINYISSKDAKFDLKDRILKAKLPTEMDQILNDKFRAMNLIEQGHLGALLSQLRSLSTIEFGHILEPDENEIDFIDALNNSQVIYFSLNTMAYEITAAAVGKLILQDLKSLASQIHGGAVTVKSDYVSIFIDEFGSFAFEGFIDFQKMCRDVGFAVHLFFQSLSDLDKVSPEFKSQVQQNCITKVILRTDDPEEADFWSSVAGTIDVIERSHQVEDMGPMQTKTGMGNQRMSKSMAVEHDVFKQLSIGQAVLIQKSPLKVDLINLYRIQ